MPFTGKATFSAGADLPELVEDLPACREYMQDIVERTSNVHFAGFIASTGQMNCASSGEPIGKSNRRECSTSSSDPSDPLPHVTAPWRQPVHSPRSRSPAVHQRA